MTTTEPRIVPPEEALPWSRSASAPALVRSLAYTAAVLGEQREAVLELHKPGDYLPSVCNECHDDEGRLVRYPCPTAQALGVTA